MPGSLNASPRSAASSSASAREPRCSAQPYGYSTRYRAPSPRPTSAVDARSTCSPPNVGHDTGRQLERLGCRRIAPPPPRRSPTRFRARRALRPGSRPGTRRSRRQPDRHLHARAPDRPPRGVEARFDGPAGGDVDRLRRARPAKLQDVRDRGSRSSPSRDPPVVNWLVTTAPNDALSPTARKRGNVGFSVTGLLIRISLSAESEA